MSHQILVTGANGQLGSAIRSIAGAYPDIQFTFLTREECDFASLQSVSELFSRMSFDGAIHCAAYTQVDKAESEPELAERINCKSVEILAKHCEEKNAVLIYLSSDYVYHNDLRRPLREDDPLLPKSVYARTKLCGEEAARRFCSRTIVLRTSWVYSHEGHNFVRTMLRLGQEGKSLRVVNDQYGTPTYAPDLAVACMHVLSMAFASRGETTEGVFGTYNYANTGSTTWFEFAREIFRLSGLSPNLTPVSSSEYPSAASRPAYSILDLGKFNATFHLGIPGWKDALRRCLQALNCLETNN